MKILSYLLNIEIDIALKIEIRVNNFSNFKNGVNRRQR